MKNKFKSVLILLLSACLTYSINLNLKSLDFVKISKTAKENDFYFVDNLSGVILNSNDRDKIGKTIRLSDIRGATPKIIYDNSSSRPLNKYCESNNSITVGFISDSSCGTDIIIINKLSGEFIRTESGNLAGMYGIVSKGIFK